MVRLRVLACGSVILAVLVFFLDHGSPTTVRQGRGLLLDKSWLKNHGAPVTPPEHVRPPDQTFLTYPEWFLVFGPAEQAEFFQGHTASKFPFLAHVHQIWESYGVVYDQVREDFPFNQEYHVMIMVIATSSTIEFGLKAAYETIIGRMTDTADGGAMTDEDHFNARFARDYVKFLDTAPWYEFDFKTRLKELWKENALLGPHPVRKWERRYILTTELAVKTVYGWLIGLGTRSAYERPKLVTAAVIDRRPAGIEAALPELKVLKDFPDGTALVTLPRYAPFATNAVALAAAGVSFKEIAGNSSAILVTVIVPHSWGRKEEDFRILFRQPLPTRPGVDRVALATPVESLSKTLRLVTGQNILLEHVYDF